eukprot:gnl/MRDRNA2_/MRDRNA2_167779_c0_seq1.p1 gnl/MRDRNA2_/MRDRNA2_167779_c0~~gnl/MRDRNA2_/MRDRNA2_167779_c0_seq1.p1  ORF type:complete len:446 (+),score=67.77 gnl/MRDRNA2_/MRDRNA2_167779_c0_seq1:136-1338(+)
MASLAFLLVLIVRILIGQCSEINISEIKVPPGFVVEKWAEGVHGARSFGLLPDGTVLVTTRGSSVYALVPQEGCCEKPRVVELFHDMVSPNGVAVHASTNSVFLAEDRQVLRFDLAKIALTAKEDGTISKEEGISVAQYPEAFIHGWKFIRMGPDGHLYVPVGAPCNVCEEQDPYATITRLKLGNFTQSGGYNHVVQDVVARGVRNTVGFDWDRETNEFFFSDNGADWMGENTPDELNCIPFGAGLDATGKAPSFGFPYCYGKSKAHPGFSDEKCISELPAVVELDAHAAALGLRFYSPPGGAASPFPAKYKKQILIAEHGSWNKQEPSGYKVSLVTVKRAGAGNCSNYIYTYAPFLQGFMNGGRTCGRPVDIEVLADGSVIISDDLSGTVFRVSYASDE